MVSSSPYISKTDFLNYLVCPGYAWAARHRPELLPKLDDSNLRRMRDGQQVEQLAQQLFPHGEQVRARAIHGGDRQTRALLASPVDVIFQPTAVSDTGLIARADVLVREGDGWHIIEIKSSSVDPAKPKNGTIKKYLNDIVFQSIAFRQAGIQINRSSMMLLNRNFRRNGGIDLHDLFILVDVTDEVEANRLAVQSQIDEAMEVLLDPVHEAACDCHRKTRPNRCALFSHFHPEIPEQNTIYNIGHIRRPELLKALDRGAMLIQEWPDEIALGPKQQRQIDIARSGVTCVEGNALAQFLDHLRYPLWYLDYETFQRPIPLWDGHGPHQQITFQYSLHKWDGHGDLEEFGYLAESTTIDPTIGLLEHLQQNLGSEGSVVVWNRSFEYGRNVEMAERYPQFASFLESVNDRMIDLADPVKNGWWEAPAFQGSWSLKRVLPVAAPDLNYKNLDIGDGSTASEQWMQAVLDSPSPLSDTEREGVLEALRIYCAQDTLAMHRIRNHMIGLLP